MATNQTIKLNLSQGDWGTLKVLVSGILGMVVVMGIGRFAFTPILPLMQRDLGLSNTVAGWLAGWNYLGYLCGSILCVITPQILRFHVTAKGALLLSLATTILMGMTLSGLYWGVLRFGSGIASAFLFIIITAEVGEALIKRGRAHWFGMIYGGIGLGIALSGYIVPQLDQVGGWDTAWVGIGIIAVILGTLATILGRELVHVPASSTEWSEKNHELRSIWLLTTAYFLEGFGYIITGTFIVAIIASTPGMETFSAYSWIVVGLSAIPSTVLWPLLARRIGHKQALMTAYFLQATGILISIQATTIAGVIFSSVAFGGTFLGIVALTLGESNLRMGKNGRRAAAILTASFGVGQMFGPVVAGMLADYQDGFSLALMLAAASVILGGILIGCDSRFHIKNR